MTGAATGYPDVDAVLNHPLHGTVFEAVAVEAGTTLEIAERVDESVKQVSWSLAVLQEQYVVGERSAEDAAVKREYVVTEFGRRYVESSV